MNRLSLVLPFLVTAAHSGQVAVDVTASTIKVVAEPSRIYVVLNWLSLILSPIGIGLTYWQVVKTKRAAVAAREASEVAVQEVRSTVVLLTIPALVSAIERIRSLIKDLKYPEATVRVENLRLQFIELQHLRHSSDTKVYVDFQESRVQLTILLEGLEDACATSPSEAFNVKNARAQLQKISDKLTDWQGALKYPERSKQ